MIKKKTHWNSDHWRGWKSKSMKQGVCGGSGWLVHTQRPYWIGQEYIIKIIIIEPSTTKLISIAISVMMLNI